MPRTYSVKEAAAILGFSTNTIYTFLNEKKLKGIRIGKGRFRIPQSEIERMTGASIRSEEIVTKEVSLNGPTRRHDDAAIRLTLHRMTPEMVSSSDWLIGLGSIILGLSMFLYTMAIDHIVQPQFMYWYCVIRILFILCGAGYLFSRFFTWVPQIWSMIYKIGLIGLYAWLMELSWIAADTLGVVIGGNFVFLLLIDLLFTPSFSGLFSLQFLFVGTVNTICIIFMPQFFVHLITSFGFTAMPDIWGQICCIGIPYFLYLLIVITHKFAPTVYHLILLASSICFLIAGYYTGVNLYWRQGFLYIFVGLVFFFHICRTSLSMQIEKKPWFAWVVYGGIFSILVSLITGLKIFEVSMSEYANRELQVKVENGKMFLETTFDFAKRSFEINTQEDTGLSKKITSKDRSALVKYGRQQYEEYPFLSRIVFLNKEGMEVGNYPDDPTIHGENFAYRPYFQDVMNTGTTVFSDAVQTADILKSNTIVIATPVVAGGEIQGVVVGSFDLGQIGQKLQSFMADENGEYFSVLDSKGVRIIHPDKEGIGTIFNKEDLQKFDNVPYWKTHLDTRVNINGKLVYSTYRKLEYSNLNLSVVEPIAENLKAVYVAQFVVAIAWILGYTLIIIIWCVSYAEYKKMKR